METNTNKGLFHDNNTKYAIWVVLTVAFVIAAFLILPNWKTPSEKTPATTPATTFGDIRDELLANSTDVKSNKQDNGIEATQFTTTNKPKEELINYYKEKLTKAGWSIVNEYPRADQYIAGWTDSSKEYYLEVLIIPRSATENFVSIGYRKGFVYKGSK